MVLRMKNLNVFGVHWKIQLLEGDSRKTNIEGGLSKKKGAWTVCQFDGELCKKEGGDVLEAGGGGGWYVDTTIHTARTLSIKILT